MCDEADTSDEQVAEQRSVYSCGDERSLERPHAPLGVRAGTVPADRVEEPLCVDSVPVHLVRSIERLPDRLEVSPSESTGTGRANLFTDPKRRLS